MAREVGTEGKLGGQANVPGVAGTWKDLTDNVNLMAANLTTQVRNIADVTTAVARGDLSRKITVDVKGEILELKNTINTMVDQLNAFAGEVTRVAREVGTEGKLGGQAQVPGVAGTWKDLTDNVNFMASNLTAQVRNIAEVATAIASGDLSKKITVDVRGEILLLKETLNTMVEQLRSFAAEVTRVAREVGTDGRLGGQAVVPGVGGTWKDLTDNVNLLAANLTTQVRNIAEVTTAVARGDLSRKITVDVKGEMLELKNTINTMVDQLNAFAAEVTRVAREVGTEGLLGGQAAGPRRRRHVEGPDRQRQRHGRQPHRAGARHRQGRDRGRQRRSRAEPDRQGQGRGRCAGRDHQQHDRHARDLRRPGHVGRARSRRRRPAGWAGKRSGRRGHVEGPHRQCEPAGGEPHDPGSRDRRSGHGRDQRRPDTIHSGRRSRRGRRAQGQHQHDDRQPAVDDRPQYRAGLAEDQPGAASPACCRGSAIWRRWASCCSRSWCRSSTRTRASSTGWTPTRHAKLALLASYADGSGSAYPSELRVGEGFVGQCALDKRRILVSDVPADTVPVGSVFFQALPRNLVVFPVVFEGQIKAVLGLASLNDFSPSHLAFLEQLTASIGIVLNSIEATMQTEGLLKQSQQLATSCRRSRRSCSRPTSSWRRRRSSWPSRTSRSKRKNQEIEQARRCARGQGGRTGADLEVQVGVPGQHVARAANAAQQHPDPRSAAGRQSRGQPDREAGGVRPRRFTAPARTS